MRFSFDILQRILIERLLILCIKQTDWEDFSLQVKTSDWVPLNNCCISSIGSSICSCSSSKFILTVKQTDFSYHWYAIDSKYLLFQTEGKIPSMKFRRWLSLIKNRWVKFVSEISRISTFSRWEFTKINAWLGEPRLWLSLETSYRKLTLLPNCNPCGLRYFCGKFYFELFLILKHENC